MPPVTLNIYDVTTNDAVSVVNRALRPLGTGAFHAGVEVNGMEWSYGFSEDEGTGVFQCEPRSCDAHKFRETIEMGNCAMSSSEIEQVIGQLAEQWNGGDYDLLRHNCCHFSDALCRALNVGPAPVWVTNLAGAGATLQNGFQKAASSAQAAAIIGAAKAGEIDEKYQISSKVDARARAVLEQVGVLDEKYKIRDKASAAASTATAGIANFANQVQQNTESLINKGKESRGAGEGEGYKVGDLTRGMFKKFGGK